MFTDTVHVIGLGETVVHYRKDGNTTIGVNDVWKHVHTDYIVCVDNPLRFPVDRLSVIENSKPKIFFSHIPEWRNYFPGTFQLILLHSHALQASRLLCKERIAKSNNSVFVAMMIAYHEGAKRIIIHGADFNTHPNLSRESLRARALKDFEFAKNVFSKQGVKLFCGHRSSGLSEVLPVAND